jgi:hypothetical protein
MRDLMALTESGPVDDCVINIVGFTRNSFYVDSLELTVSVDPWTA